MPELKQVRNHRRHLGRVDENGNIIPSTKKRDRPPKERPEAAMETVVPNPDLPAEIRSRNLEIAGLENENRKLRALLSKIDVLLYEAGSEAQLQAEVEVEVETKPQSEQRPEVEEPVNPEEEPEDEIPGNEIPLDELRLF